MPQFRLGDAIAAGSRKFSVGAVLRQARLDAGMRLADVAEGIVSVGYLSMIEQGQRTPTQAVLRQLAHRLGLEEAEVQRRSDEAMEIHDVCRLHAAEWADVEGDAAESEALFRQLAAQTSSVQIDARWALAHILIRDHRDVEALDTAIDILRDPMFRTFPHWEMAVQVLLASAFLKVGEVDTAVVALEEMVSQLAQASDGSMLTPFTQLMLARAYLQSDRPDDALLLLAKVDEFAAGVRSLPELRSRALAWWKLRERSLGEDDLVGAVRFSERAIGLVQELWRADALLVMRAEAAALFFRFGGEQGLQRAREIVRELALLVSSESSKRIIAAVWLMSAEISLRDGDPGKALTHIDSMHAINAEADPTWGAMIRSRAFAMLGDTVEAIGQAEVAKERLRPKLKGMYRSTQFTEPWERLALMFRDLGCMDDAWECMRIAMRGAGAVPAGPRVTPPVHRL